MHNEVKYPRPHDFEGLRFVKEGEKLVGSASVKIGGKGRGEEPMRGTVLTDASRDFPIWGLGSKVW